MQNTLVDMKLDYFLVKMDPIHQLSLLYQFLHYILLSIQVLIKLKYQQYYLYYYYYYYYHSFCCFISISCCCTPFNTCL
eukprot:UN09946